MARYFLRLKFALLGRSLRTRGSRAVSFVLGSVFGALLALEGFGLLALAGHRGDLRASLPPVVFTAAFLAWITLPIFAWGIDETLDPTRLALLPLSRRQLMSGLFAASSAGIAPAATLVALSGALAGYATAGPGALIVVAAILIEFSLCLVGARAVTTALSRLMRSRRARDAWAVLASLIGLMGGALGQVFRLAGRTRGRGALIDWAGVLGWFPPGMLGRAVAGTGRGALLIPTLELVPAGILAALLGWWWAAGLERLLTTVEQPSAGAKEATAGPASIDDLFARSARILPRNRRGAVGAKDLRYLRRDPLLRVQRVMSVVYALGSVGAFSVLALRNHAPAFVLASALLAWWLTLSSMTQFGFDRSAYWMNAAAAGDAADDLIGKNLAIGVAVLPIFTAAAVAIAAVSGGWTYLPLGVVLAAAVIGLRLGVGNVASVRLARPMSESTTNMWSRPTGQGCGTALVLLGVFLLDALLLAPLAGLVLGGLYGWRPLLFLTAPVAVGYSFVLYRVGLGIASRWVRAHQPELLEALSPRQAA